MSHVAAHPEHETAAAGERLRAGPLEATFCDGALRYLRVGGIEVVRRVYVGVRDTDWGTVAGTIDGLRLETGPFGFGLTFEAHHLCNEIDFRWTGNIVGRSAGQRDASESRIGFTMEGIAERTFQTCRTGICLLHPLLYCAGAECRITHPDGRATRGRFPERIAPRQVFGDVVGMAQSFPGGLKLNIAFSGDVFETEDQRNWADGSFKTYARPLALPFPYVLERGQPVRQAVNITVTGNASAVSGAEHDLTVKAKSIGRFPGVGLTLSAPLTPSERARVGALQLSHVRVDVRLADVDWRARFLKLAREARALALAMELAVHADKECESAFEELASLAEQSGAAVCRWITYEVRCPLPSGELMAAARRHLVSAPLGCGTVGSFAEVNRRPPPPGDASRVIAYSLHPQVHGTDDLTLIENLEAQPETVRSARRVAPGLAVAVGPVTLHRRPDPFAAGKGGDEEPAQPDPRQATMFGAAWALGSIASLCRAAPDAITCFDAVGPFGVMSGGHPFPLYHVLADVGEFAGAAILDCTGIDALAGAALALRKGSRVRIMVASFGRELALSFTGLASHRMTDAFAITSHGTRPLDSLARPIRLNPFSIVRIDLASMGGARR